MTNDLLTDPFAGVRPRVPTRYAPGDTSVPYAYPKTGSAGTWYPVIYYPVGEVVQGEGPIWLVEPYPAIRADGTDGQDPIDDDGGAGVTVVCRDSTPVPRGADPDGDWVIPQRSKVGECAYDVYVTGHTDLMAAWCEAYAIAAALNSGLVKALGLHSDDVDVLLAAERGVLTGDSRFVGTINELRWTALAQGEHERREQHRVPVRQARRLRASLAAVEVDSIERKQPSRPELSTAGRPWTEATYRLTRAGKTMLAEIRRAYDGPARCRVCGCTEDKACPDGCAWVPDPELADLCSSCPADDPEAARRYGDDGL